MNENEAEDFFGFRVVIASLDKHPPQKEARSESLAGKIKQTLGKLTG
jgi:hypothetical protein